MAKFESQYKELTFFVKEGKQMQMRTFHEGVYVTEDKKEIEALENEPLATRIEEEKPKAKKKAEAK